MDENDTLVTLIRLAQGDPVVRRKLLVILDLAKEDRGPAILTLMEQMSLGGAEHSQLSSLSILTSDSAAQTAKAMLLREGTEDTSLTRPVWYALLSTFVALVCGGATLVTGILIGTLPPAAWLWRQCWWAAPLAVILLFAISFIAAMYGIDLLDTSTRNLNSKRKPGKPPNIARASRETKTIRVYAIINLLLALVWIGRFLITSSSPDSWKLYIGPAVTLLLVCVLAALLIRHKSCRNSKDSAKT